jgi:type IV secretory pathway protease TraF
MKINFKKPSKKEVFWLLSCLSFPPALILFFQFFGFFISVSGSVPIGIYKKVSYKTNYGIFCLPDKVAQEGLKHEFITNSSKCKNGVEPLIKNIIANNNDFVLFDES